MQNTPNVTITLQLITCSSQDIEGQSHCRTLSFIASAVLPAAPSRLSQVSWMASTSGLKLATNASSASASSEERARAFQELAFQDAMRSGCLQQVSSGRTAPSTRARFPEEPATGAKKRFIRRGDGLRALSDVICARHLQTLSNTYARLWLGILLGILVRRVIWGAWVNIYAVAIID